MVIDVAKEHFPKMSIGFEDPRVHVHVGDGCAFVKNAPDATYDAIIVDSSDPVGPATVLYKKPFYENAHRALLPGGVICCMAECIWIHTEIIKSMAKTLAESFADGSVSYGIIGTPTYPWYDLSGDEKYLPCGCSGQVGMLVAMKHIPDEDPPNPLAPQELYYLKGNDKDPPSLQSVSQMLSPSEMIICVLGIIMRASIVQRLAFHSLQRKAYRLFSPFNS